MAKSATGRPKRRAPKGGGSVYQRTDRPGVWIAEVRGPERQRRNFTTRAAASAWLASINPEVVPGGKITLAGWLDEWLKEPSRSAIAPSTESYYRGMAATWKDSTLARRAISSITPEMIENQLDAWLRDGDYSRTTVIHLRTVLGTALNKAAKARRIVASPVMATRIPGKAEANRVRQIRISPQVARDLSDAWVSSPHRLALDLLLHTGLRPAELLALTWGDVQIGPCILTVRSAVKSRRHPGAATEWFVGEPKTSSSRRDVSFDPVLRGLIIERNRAHASRLLGRRAGEDDRPPDTDWVFPDPIRPDQPMRPSDLSKAFREIVDDAGVSVRPGVKRSELRLYDLRGIHASLLLAAGVDAPSVASRLGHTDIVSTMRRYAGVVGEADRRAAGKARVWDSLRLPPSKRKAKPAAEPKE